MTDRGVTYLRKSKHLISLTLFGNLISRKILQSIYLSLPKIYFDEEVDAIVAVFDAKMMKENLLMGNSANIRS